MARGEERAVLEIAAVVDGHDAGVTEAGHDAGLAPEVSSDRGVSDVLWIDELDGHLSVEAIVVGGENRGISRLVRERCDVLAAIPLRGKLASLNASVAASIALYEAVRQRAGQAEQS